MSVYNRKMFKRNARKALDQVAGVPPVQKFQVGGVVSPNINYQTYTSPLTGKTFSGVAPSGGGITSLQPLDIATRYIQGGRAVGYGDDFAISPGEYAALQAYQSANQAGRTVKDPTGTRVGSALEGVLNPAARVAAGGGAFVRGLAEQTLQGALGSGEAGTETFGDRVSAMKPGDLDKDFLRDLGLVENIDAKNMQTASSRGRPMPTTPADRIPDGGMAASRIEGEKFTRGTIDDSPEVLARIRAEQEARKQMAEQGIVISDEETGQMPPSTDEIQAQLDNIMRDKDAKQAEYQAAVEAADRDDATVDLAVLKDAAKADSDGTKGGDGEGDGSKADSDAAPSSKEEIDRVINSGTQEEQEKTLDGFINEFMEKAPGYEGSNNGLVLAKIGFAMAAGKSPNAIENIASAMSDGADMLIKDKAKRDEFDRQLKLSAMQYGLGEVGKLRAEDRLETRERRATKDYVAGPNGAIYNGREFGANESIPVTVGDIRDGNIPKGAIAPATLSAMATQAKATAASLAKKLENKEISMTEYDKQMEKYNKAVTTAITSEIGIGLLEGAMIQTAEGKVTGITPAIKSMLNEGANFFGMDLGKEYETLDDVRNAMRASLQDLVPVTLGEAQSANSISNRDVDFLIEAYFGRGALDGGKLSFATTDPDQMVGRLQRAAGKMRNSQKGAFSTMTQVQNTLTPVFQPGTLTSAAQGLSVEQERLAQAGLGPQGTATFTSTGLVSAGKDQATGLPRFKFG